MDITAIYCSLLFRFPTRKHFGVKRMSLAGIDNPLKDA